MGMPMSSQPGTSLQSVKLPPVPCGPHSIRWPDSEPWLSLSQSSSFQPNSCIKEPSATALSAQRPVITISAPASSATAMGRAPR